MIYRWAELLSRGTSPSWANNSAVKFNKDKYIALHLEQDNPMYHHSLGSNCLGIW